MCRLAKAYRQPFEVLYDHTPKQLLAMLAGVPDSWTIDGRVMGDVGEAAQIRERNRRRKEATIAAWFAECNR